MIPMHILILVLIMPGLACGYALVLRPLLAKIPALQKFYAEADGFWAKVWALCGNSLTIAWSWLLAGIGTAMSAIDPIAAALGDPDLKSQVANALQSNPKILGYVTIGISAVTIIARLRSISKG
jgi:hypothetical protein